MNERTDARPAADEAAGGAASAAERGDATLLAATAAGDRGAFDTLYRRYYSRLSDFVARVLRRPELVEEVVNDTMYAVWTGSSEFAGRSRVSTWIFGIAYRKALKRLEREKRTAADALQEGFDLAGASDPGSEADAVRLQHQFEIALAQLSPAQRSVVELTFLLEYSYEETAAIVGCPVNTVKTRMFHARARLRELLGAAVCRQK